MSAEKPQKKEKRPPEGHPRQEQIGPRTPRMVGTITRARCSNCGAVLQPGFDPKGKCPKCAFELHSCKQCAYFDTAARFECMQPIPERIPRKDQRNDCRLYEFRTNHPKTVCATQPLSAFATSGENCYSEIANASAEQAASRTLLPLFPRKGTHMKLSISHKLDEWREP